MSNENENRQQYYQETVRQARQTDLVEYLTRTGIKLRRVGQWYTLEEHDSIRIQGNKWFWNSQGKSGNAVDFLVDVLNMTPSVAIKELTGVTLAELDKPIEPPKTGGVNKKRIMDAGAFDDVLATHEFSMSDITLNKDQRRVIAYLTKHRGISTTVVLDEIRGKNLFQEVQHRTSDKTGEPKEIHNAIFAIKDEHGAIVGAEAVGTLSYENARFKAIKTGSKYGYGYSTGQGENPRYIMFFESAIDVLSFATIKRAQSKRLNGCLLVSMAGVKISVVRTMLKAFGESAQPVFCVDNDEAGVNFVASSLGEFPNARVHKPEKGYKDWNDQLLDRKIES